MATETQTQERSYTNIEMLTSNCPDLRRVSMTPDRPPRDDEIPLIELSGIEGDLETRKRIADCARKAAENTRFFCIQNYGIDHNLIEDALSQAEVFSI